MHPQDPLSTNEKNPIASSEHSVAAGAEKHALLEQILAETKAAQISATSVVKKPIGFTPKEISAIINTDVVARHADDAPFLWMLRDRAVSAPHYTLHDLSKVDERVEAHLDGLRVAGSAGWVMSEKGLSMGGPGEVFTAGVLAMEENNPEWLDRVVDAACQNRLLQRGLISAAGWVEVDSIRGLLDSWVRSDDSRVRRLGIGGLAVRRLDPGQVLVHRLYDDDPNVRARSLQAVVELGISDLLPMVLHLREDRDQVCRFLAAFAAAKLGDRSKATLHILRELAEIAGRCQEPALALAIRCMPLPQSVDWVRRIWKDPNHLRLAAVGAGACGDPALLGVIIEWMELERVARVAGEAFSYITGADLKYLDLNQDPPSHTPTDDRDEFEVLDADRDLPYPAAEKVARWWQANRDRFEPGQRYLGGFKIAPPGLLRVLREAKQRLRAAAALELALLQPSAPLFEVRARGVLQEAKLQSWIS